KRTRHMLANIFVETTQEQFAAIQQARVTTEAVKNAGELDSDITATHHDRTPRQLIQKEHIVGTDNMLVPGEFGDVGPSTRSDQDAFSAVGGIPDNDPVRVNKPCPPFH